MFKCVLLIAATKERGEGGALFPGIWMFMLWGLIPLHRRSIASLYVSKLLSSLSGE